MNVEKVYCVGCAAAQNECVGFGLVKTCR